MYRAYKFRLYPTNEQKIALLKKEYEWLSEAYSQYPPMRWGSS